MTLMTRDVAARLGHEAGAFDEVVFAITDWSPEQRVIGPFQHVFTAAE